MSWEKVRLGDLCSVITKGTTPSNIGASFTNEGVKYIRSEMLTSSKYISGQFLHISSDTHEKLKRSQLKEGDILFSMAGAYLGKTAILRDIDVPANTNQAAALIRIDEQSCNREYIYYFLNIPEMIKKANTVQSQSAQPNINLKQISMLEIEVPDRDSQNRIVDILSAYDNLIENNQKQIKLLEEAAQRLYKQWFVDLHFPGYEDTEIVDGVPEGWKYLNISELCNRVNAGGTPSRQKPSFYSKEGYRWFKTKELQDCWLLDSEEHISEEGLTGSSAKLFPKNTIVMAIYASPTLGRLGILREEATTNQAALCMEVNEEICSWQWLYLKLYELRDGFNAIARGAGQQNISGDTVKNTSVFLPKKSLLDKFTFLVETIFEKEYLLDRQIGILQQSRDRLLPKLMSGELEV